MSKFHLAYTNQPANTTMYIRNPRDYKQVLQVQSREGDSFKCFLVTGGQGANVTVDNTKAIYIHHESEIKEHKP